MVDLNGRGLATQKTHIHSCTQLHIQCRREAHKQMATTSQHIPRSNGINDVEKQSPTIQVSEQACKLDGTVNGDHVEYVHEGHQMHEGMTTTRRVE